MTSTRSPSIPDDTYEELIEATVAAVYKHGYAEVGVRDIGAEFSKSRQLINHYFDGKDELITELLQYILDYADEPSIPADDGDPLARLNQEINDVLLGEHMNDDEFWVIMTIIYDIYAQAHHNPDHRNLINQISDEYVECLEGILRDGIERGVFRDIDTERTARIIDDLITATHLRKITLGHEEAPAETRETIDRFVIPQLLVDPSMETTLSE